MPRVVKRSWGYYIDLIRTKYLCIKIMHFDANSKLSHQRHFHRAELWWHIGTANFTWIPKMMWHTFQTAESCNVLEIQIGSDVRESDIERV